MRNESLSARLMLIVLCGSAIAMMSFGVRSAFGLFTEPLSAA